MRSPAPALRLTADALAIRHMARALRFVAAGLVGTVVPGKVDLRLAEVVMVLPAVTAERHQSSPSELGWTSTFARL